MPLLLFGPAQNPRSADPAVPHLVRFFPRQSRWEPAVLSALGSGRLILRDGCFRIEGDGATQPLVLFGRDTELSKDEDGYLVVIDPRGHGAMGGNAARVGEPVVWSGPRGVDEDDAGVQALRAACGSDPIVAIGEPRSQHLFDLARPARP